MNSQIPLLESIHTLLNTHGYTILQLGVEDKNQTRFNHFKLQKENKLFFAKVNVDDSTIVQVENQLIVSGLNDGDTFCFVKVVDCIHVSQNRKILIFPYIDLSPMSRESTNFRELNIDKKDWYVFFKALSDTCSAVMNSDIKLTPIKYDYNQKFLEWRKIIPKNDKKILEALNSIEQSLISSETFLAINDIQLQNMFWDNINKKLFLFDLEHLSHEIVYYDVAKFAASCAIVYNRFSLSHEWLDFYINQKSNNKEREELIEKIHFALIFTSIDFYVYFLTIANEPSATKSKHSFENTFDQNKRFIKWCIEDFSTFAKSRSS